jgi:hypothetical protein
METLAELNKKYKAVLDSMKNKKKNDDVDSNDSDSIDSSDYDPYNFDPFGIALSLALDGRLDELQYIWKSSESSDED